MHTFPVPDRLEGTVLTGELADAGVDAVVWVDGDMLVVDTDADETTVREVVESHVPPDPDPDPDAELDAGLAEVAGRDDVPEWGLALISQLRGQGGHQGRAAGRRPE